MEPDATLVTLVVTAVGMALLSIERIVRFILDVVRKPPETLTKEAVRHVVQEETRQMCEQTTELHKWHNRTDEDGVPVWYVRSTLERSIENLIEASNAQTLAINRLVDRLEAEAQERKRIQDLAVRAHHK